MKNIKSIFLFLLLSLMFEAQTVIGTLDTGDRVQYENFGKPNDLVLLQDKSFLVFANYNKQGLIYKLNSNGTLDTNFGVNGKVVISNPAFQNSDVKFIGIFNDGKILFNQIGINTQTQNKFGKLNADGSLDNTYSSSWSSLGSAAYLNSPKILPNGKTMATYNNGIGCGVARFNTDGTLDTTFGLNGIYSISNTLFQFLNVVSDDYILISATYGGTQGIYTNGIVGNSGNADTYSIDAKLNNQKLYLINSGKLSRFNLDATLDTTFGNRGKFLFNSLSIYGDTAFSNANTFQLTLGNQNIKIQNINDSGSEVRYYDTSINTLGNLQIGKIIKEENIFYVMASGTELNKAVLLKITDPLFTLSVKNLNESNNFKIYPNPSKDFVEFSDYITAFSIYDATGNKILNGKKTIKRLNVSTLAKGIYWIEGQKADNSTFKEKLIKQ